MKIRQSTYCINTMRTCKSAYKSQLFTEMQPSCSSQHIIIIVYPGVGSQRIKSDELTEKVRTSTESQYELTAVLWSRSNFDPAPAPDNNIFVTQI